MKFLILVTVLMMSQLGLADGGREGGGGTIEQMRAARSLSVDDIKQLTANNGLRVKKEVLTFIPTYWKASELPKDAKKVFKEMTSNDTSLVDDFTFSVYKTDCTCPQDKDMCTENRLFADICIDVNSLVKKQVKFSEFIGLLVHEHSHHFAGEMDHENEMGLAHFIEDKAQENTLLGKIFNEPVAWGKSYLMSNGSLKFQADSFCKHNKLTESLTWKVKSKSSLDNYEKFVWFDEEQELVSGANNPVLLQNRIYLYQVTCR